MLSKEICLHCVEHRAKMAVNPGKEAIWLGWSSTDEVRWKDGRVSCRFSTSGLVAQISKDPPSWCPYALEHLMKAQ